MKSRYITAAIAVVMVSACGKNNEAEHQEPPADPKVEALDTMIGQWQSNCTEGQAYSLTSKSNVGITQRSKLEVFDKTLTETTIISASPCDTSDIEVTSVSSYELDTTSRPEVMSLPLKIKTYQVKPVTEFGVRVLNLAKWCGIEDWTLEQSRDVTSSAGKDNCFKDKSISAVMMNDGGRLYFGRADQLNSTGQIPDYRKNFYYTRL